MNIAPDDSVMLSPVRKTSLALLCRACRPFTYTNNAWWRWTSGKWAIVLVTAQQTVTPNEKKKRKRKSQLVHKSNGIQNEVSFFLCHINIPRRRFILFSSRHWQPRLLTSYPRNAVPPTIVVRYYKYMSRICCKLHALSLSIFPYCPSVVLYLLRFCDHTSASTHWHSSLLILMSVQPTRIERSLR